MNGGRDVGESDYLVIMMVMMTKMKRRRVMQMTRWWAGDRCGRRFGASSPSGSSLLTPGPPLLSWSFSAVDQYSLVNKCSATFTHPSITASLPKLVANHTHNDDDEM